MSIIIIMAGALALEGLSKAALSIYNRPRRIVTGGKR